MAAIVIGVLSLGYIAGLAVYVISASLRAGRVLDPVLAPLGMTTKRYMLFGRQYRGEIAGREVEVYFVPSRANWPAQLDIYVEADIGTRVAIGRQRPLLDCRHCARLEVVGAEMEALQVYAQDAERATRLLSDAANSAAIARLLDDQEAYGLREVYLQPERVWLRAHPRRMEGKRFRQWLDAVLVLAR